MQYNLKSVKEIDDVKGKTVLLRVDLDVPLKDGKIEDETRLNAWFETLEYLVRRGAKVIIAGHLGRPKGKDEKFSLFPIASYLSKKINSKIQKSNIDGFEGWKLAQNVFLLENLRFFRQEEENDEEFSKKLAGLADIYVNDAFSATHRNHASIVGITKFIPSFAGLHLLKEVEVLSKVLEDPKRPLCVIIGGAKIETKLPLVEKMHKFSDFVLVGGEIAENTKILLKVQHEKLSGKKSMLLVADLTLDGKDITQKSAENFLQIAQNAKTIIWNGPMGLIEEKEYEKATEILAKGIINLDAYKIVGGGDTIAFLNRHNLQDKFDFVSTGGGAMLEFLSGEKLPGLLVLE
ncbi:MAG: phosphoglycerate kinase [Candidatus Levybacteria bacterium]|nr:phosphoglycerate kinase [Candidatus Levybacteria bacterium]